MQHASKNNKFAVMAATSMLLTAAPATAQLSLQQALMLRAHGAATTASSATRTTQSPITVTAPGSVAPPVTTEDALHDLADQAAVIFTGQVAAIRTEAGAVAIDLLVEDGVRGVASGSTYTLREWSGLWTGNADRMHVGQRALFLLHEPSVGGFSSPVGGADGIIPVTGDDVTAAVDLRWIAARVRRTLATRADNAPDGTAPQPNTVYATTMARVEPTAVHRTTAARDGIAWPTTAAVSNVLGIDLHSIDRTLVTGLLRSWQPVTPDAAEVQ